LRTRPRVGQRRKPPAGRRPRQMASERWGQRRNRRPGRSLPSGRLRSPSSRSLPLAHRAAARRQSAATA
jgi:hypothetical protein